MSTAEEKQQTWLWMFVGVLKQTKSSLLIAAVFHPDFYLGICKNEKTHVSLMEKYGII